MVKERKLFAIVIALSMFAIISPAMLWRIPVLALFFNYMRKLAFVAALYLFFRKKLFEQKYLVIYMTFFMYMIAISYLMNGTYSRSWDNFYLNFSVAVFTVYGMRNYPKYFISYMAVMLTLWIVLNTLTWKEGGAYLTSNGQYGFFLGTKTTVTQYQVVAFFFVDLFRAVLKEKDKFIANILLVLNVMSIIVYYICQPISSSVICLAIYLLLHFFSDRLFSLKRNILNYAFWGCIVLNFSVVFLNVQNYFEYFIVDILREDLTLNNRTFIWRVVLLKCLDSPIWGHGFDSDITFSLGEFTSYNQSAHNQLLSWLFLGGIIGFVFMILLVAWALHMSNADRICGCSYAVKIVFLELSFLWIAEQFNTYTIFTAVIMICFSLDILNQIEVRGKRVKILLQSR